MERLIVDGAGKAPRATPSTPLLRVLGVGFGLAAVVGGAVGQGILRAPGLVAGPLGDPLLILGFWVAGGALALIDAFAVVELGSSIRKSGGPYSLAARAFGSLPGTLVGWIDWVAQVATVAYLAVVFAEYVQRFAPLAPVPVVAVVLIGVFTALNLTGTRLSGAAQSVGSAAKGLGLLLLVGLLFMAGEPAAPAPAASATVTLAAAAIAMRAVYNTYVGWNTSVYFCEEIEAPERNIARATFGGILLITILYVLVNAALLHVLTPGEIARSTLPAADAVTAIVGSWGGALVTGLAIVSIAAAANLTLMFASRIGHAMAADGAVTPTVARVSPNGTPWVSLLLTAAGAAAFAALGGYEQLVAIAAPAALGVAVCLDAAAIVLRIREPDLPRPFRMPLFPLPALLGMVLNLGLLAALAYEDPVNTSVGFSLVAVLGAIYAARRIRRGELPPEAAA